MDQHRNNIGLLRLAFASLVIIGHSPEMIDGDRSREPLTMIFHSVSLGELSVDGFFLLSGYLITQSMIRETSLRRYFERRLLRIVPAFLAAFLLCEAIISPLVGGHPLKHIIAEVGHLLTLAPPPNYPDEFTGLHYPYLDGVMWTIAYEFRCYALAALLGIAGILDKRWIVLSLAIGGILVGFIVQIPFLHNTLDAIGRKPKLAALIGSPLSTIRLTTIFLLGSSFFIFRDEIIPRLDGRVAAVCSVIAIALLFVRPCAEIGLCVFGGAAMFWLGLKANLGALQKINDRWDISYGVYLYGWPIATLILWQCRTISPAALAASALPVSFIAGAASWWGLEKYAKGWVRRPSANNQQGLIVDPTAT